MSRKTELTSAVGATAMFFMIAGVSAGSAFAQNGEMELLGPVTVPAPVLPFAGVADQSEADPADVPEPANEPEADGAAMEAVTLAELVEQIAPPARLSDELKCLANAVYFESRGEPLSGQLAVAQVIVNRAESSRFPGSYCSVVRQPRQFSFVRAGHIPQANKGSLAWRRAQAIALIAHQGLWDSPVKDALFFHATHVQPRWNLQRLARVSSHVFYR